MKKERARYQRCKICHQSLLICDCACPYCGTKNDCDCELMSLTTVP